MTINIFPIQDKIVSHAMTLGLFETVNMYEPKNSPGNGITAAVWIQDISPVPRGSGLAATSGRLEFRFRIYQNMLAEPQDEIDPAIIAAVDQLMTAYSADFELGATVKNVDLLGEHGTPLSAKAGYINVDGKMFRIMDITIPLIINDIWSQGE